MPAPLALSDRHQVRSELGWLWPSQDTKQKFKGLLKSAKQGTEKLSQLARESFAEGDDLDDVQARAAAAMAAAHHSGGKLGRLGRLGRR